MKKIVRIVVSVGFGGAFLYLLLSATYLWVCWLQAIPNYKGNEPTRILLYLAAANALLLMYGIPLAFLWARSGRPRAWFNAKLAGALLLVETLVLVDVWMIPEKPRLCTSCDFVVGGLNLNLSTDRMSPEELAQRFGGGCAAKSDGWVEGRKYYFPKSGASLLITYNHLMISEAQQPAPACKAKTELAAYGTGKGVNLGDGRQKVIETYGEPTELYAAVSNKPVLIYRMPNNAMSFHIVNDKVDSIELWGP